MSWCFSFKFLLEKNTRISINEENWIINRDGDEIVSVSSTNSAHKISESEILFLKGSGYADQPSAQGAAGRWRDIFTLALVDNLRGCDFGEGPGSGGFTEEFLEARSQELGVTLVNGNKNLQIFECESPRFAISLGPVHGLVGLNAASIEHSIAQTVSRGGPLGPRARLACSLFSSALRAGDSRAKLVILATAIEAFIEEEHLSTETQELVKNMMAMAQSAKLPESEKASIIGRIRSIKKESIGQAGSRILKEMDETKGGEYNNESAASFFKRCYNIRSNIVHANPNQPISDEIGRAIPELQKLARDVIVEFSHQ